MNDLNILLADLNVLYTKLHNFHYNVVGKDFMTVHKILEVEYDQVHGWIDDVAEMIKKEDVYPLGSLKKYLEVATINDLEDDKDYDSSFIYKTLIQDYTSILSNIIAFRPNLTQENIIDFLNEVEDVLKTKIWFFKASNK